MSMSSSLSRRAGQSQPLRPPVPTTPPNEWLSYHHIIISYNTIQYNTYSYCPLRGILFIYTTSSPHLHRLFSLATALPPAWPAQRPAGCILARLHPVPAPSRLTFTPRALFVKCRSRPQNSACVHPYNTCRPSVHSLPTATLLCGTLHCQQTPTQPLEGEACADTHYAPVARILGRLEQTRPHAAANVDKSRTSVGWTNRPRLPSHHPPLSLLPLNPDTTTYITPLYCTSPHLTSLHFTSLHLTSPI